MLRTADIVSKEGLNPFPDLLSSRSSAVESHGRLASVTNFQEPPRPVLAYMQDIRFYRIVEDFDGHTEDAGNFVQSVSCHRKIT